MSSIPALPPPWHVLTAMGLLAVGALPGPLAAQDGRQEGAAPAAGVTAEEALETARDAYSVPEQRVSACPENTMESEEGEEGDVIIVCRQLAPEYQYQTRDGPAPQMNRTAGGAPRAPDLTTIPSCIPGQGLVCMKFGYVPPPVLMVDVTKFPEPLPPEVAAKVFRAPPEDEPPAPKLTGERVPIPLD